MDSQNMNGVDTAVSTPANQTNNGPVADPIIELQNVTKVYHTGSGDFTALKNINLKIGRGQFFGIIGKSGAGKTTLLNMISGVSEITQGEVLYYPQDSSTVASLGRLEEDDLAVWRGKNLGVVYQSFELLPNVDLVTNIMMPQDFAGTYHTKISKERALELLDIVELTEHAYKLPAHISGGQKQRVAIARALVNDPELIVADEPTGSLDTVTSETIFRIFERLVSQGKTIIMVTHDQELSTRFSQRIQIADGVLYDESVDLTTIGFGGGHSVKEDIEESHPETEPEDLESEEDDELPVLHFYSGSNANREHQGETAVHLDEVVKTYVNAAGAFTALKGIDLDIHYGKFISIVGKSGSGKSTLLNMLTGIDHPTTGDVIIGGENIYKMSESQRAKWRGRNMGIVFQFFQLLPTLSLLENTMLPMDYTNIFPANERVDRAMELLRMVGLEEHAYDLPASVSNGQQQSAAIARSLANDPPIIVADEPTGNLDSRSANNIIRVFQQLADRGKTILIVTHDPSLTSRTDETIIISDGEIIDDTIATTLPNLEHPLMLLATKQLEKRVFKPGESILTLDQAVDHFYMVANGSVAISKNGKSNPIATLNKGQFFGEVELMNNGRSIANVYANSETAVEIAMIPKDTFQHLMDESPAIQEEFKRIATERQTENQQAKQQEAVTE